MRFIKYFGIIFLMLFAGLSLYAKEKSYSSGFYDVDKLFKKHDFRFNVFQEQDLLRTLSEPERQALYERHRKSYGLIILSPIGLGGLMQGDMWGGGLSAGAFFGGLMILGQRSERSENWDNLSLVIAGGGLIFAGVVGGIVSFIIYTYNWNDNLEYSLHSGARISFFDQPEVFFDKEGKYQLGINFLSLRY